MKALVVLAAVLAMGAGYVLLNGSAIAGPNAKVTLSAGESVTVRRDGCNLKVTKDSAATVKVKCEPQSGFTSAIAGQVQADDVTLTEGKKLKILASACMLSVAKNKPSKVKVKCKVASVTNTPTRTATPTRTPTPTTTPSEPPDASVVVAPGGSLSFSGVANIKVGDTVEWTWAGSGHTVTSGDGTADGLFCSPNDTNCSTSPSSSNGSKYRHTFDTVGTFPYFCRFHDGMTSSVNVTAP